MFIFSRRHFFSRILPASLYFAIFKAKPNHINEFNIPDNSHQEDNNSPLASSYEVGPIHILNYRQVIYFDGGFYGVKNDVVLPFVTTGSDLASWHSDSKKFFSITEDGNELISRINYSNIFFLLNAKNSQHIVTVDGFYSSNDGGQGEWILTGNIDKEKAGMHFPKNATAYNAFGVEYRLRLKDRTIVNPKINGAKEISGIEISAMSSDGFVCLGEVINGIYSTLPVLYQPNNNIESSTTFKALKIVLSDGLYRIGKESIKLRSNIQYDFGKSTIYVKGRDAGVYINGLEHSVEDIDDIYKKCGERLNWESVSLGFTLVRGGHFIGDHVPGTYDEECSSGIGILALNPWYCSFEDIRIENFRVNLVGMQVRTENDGVFPNEIIPYISNILPEKIGNFYGCVFKNLYVSTARYCCARLHIDWCQWIGGTISNNGLWGSSKSGQQCDFYLIETGHGFHCSAAYLSIPAYNPLERAPNKSVIATAARGSVYTACYMENTPSFITVLNKWWTNGNEKGFGLNIDCIASQYRPERNYKFLTFEKNAFGYYGKNNSWTPPTGYASYPSTNGIDFFRFGSPCHDIGAFKHGGFDFKYGTYGISYELNDQFSNPPDVDTIRGNIVSKEMFSPYGLIVSNGILNFPIQFPVLHSNICIWFKDLSNNFDLNNISLWRHGNLEQKKTKGNAELFVSIGECVIDYGNGYKMAILQNLKWNNNDEFNIENLYSSLKIIVPEETPIILKAIQAYSGGVPIFPMNLNYIPESADNCIWGNIHPSSGKKLGLMQNIGGGIFFIGDIINPWIGVTSRHDFYSPNISWQKDAVSTNMPRIVESGSCIGMFFCKVFTVVVNNVNEELNLTEITVSAKDLPYIYVGVPLCISSTSTSTSTSTCEVSILSRIIEDGILTNRYILTGIVGEIGTLLVVNQRMLAARKYVGGYAFGSIEINEGQIDIVKSKDRGSKQGLNFYMTDNRLTPSASMTATEDSILFSAGSFWFNNNICFSPDKHCDFASADSPIENIFVRNAISTVADKNNIPIIRNVPDNILDIWGTISAKAYKYDWAIRQKGDDMARWHVGWIAQDIVDAFAKAGENASEWALVVYNESSSINTPLLTSPEYTLQNKLKETSEWRVILDECNAMELLYQRRQLKRLSELL